MVRTDISVHVKGKYDRASSEGQLTNLKSVKIYDPEMDDDILFTCPAQMSCCDPIEEDHERLSDEEEYKRIPLHRGLSDLYHQV